MAFDFSEISLFAIFIVLFFGTFVSEDAACLTAGTLVAQGRISFAFAIAACLAGIFVGDMLLYGAGRLFGQKILNAKFVSRFVSKEAVSRGSEWLNKHGVSAVFVSRFVTGLRLPTYFAAGTLKTSFVKFALVFLIAAAIWTPLLVGGSGYAQQIFFQQNAIIGLIILVIVLRLAWKLSSRKNRRLLIGRLRRFYKWEFWPVQIFYLPVVMYVLFLGIKYRSMTVFTAANPAIPAGGFKGESKDEIYHGFRDSRYVLPHVLIKKDRNLENQMLKAKQFIDENDLTFPVVIKPDTGERGKGVKFACSESELRDAIAASDRDLIVQEFASGEEVSIFYYRFPQESRGKIFSITEKQFPFVVGDGESTIEDLILQDKRAICMATQYFEQNRSDLKRVPPLREKVQIIDIGTHSRGAIFLDGGWLKTDALEAKIDETCRSFDGFYFGRFDIRAASFEQLMRGENFKIIELNGVTSESTNIYDPQYSLIQAYRILFTQWRIAFEIGAENRRRGTMTTTAWKLARLAFGLS